MTNAADESGSRSAHFAQANEAVALGRLDPFETAVVEAVAYADVFDWPLTAAEVHRFLPVPGRLGEVESALASPHLHRFLSASDGLISLAGREGLVLGRYRRAAISARMWPRAVRYARVVASLPFVRLVAVTGSLAVGAADAGADVDLFVVTEDHRLWLTRALTIGVVRGAGRQGVRLCPNYFLTESALELTAHDLFTAHELLQMVPIAGGDAYRGLLARNDWCRQFLPNHPGHAAPPDQTGAGQSRGLGTGLVNGFGRRFAESALRRGAFDPLERWEMRRKIERLSAGARSEELRFDESACKGHVDEHRRWTLAQFQERLTRINEAAA